ncbi:hypothetical protein EG328_001390 [Venturia inaequalis]|uniref:Stress response protein ish1 n=1 Tax=Venturia inaequalis TaxID=5025 RepID=A0A8H3UXM3_VENIN|nr:hypothetical protein EG328_001390 [Venturia inaequalis]RDI88935.1 hypothetical protein Vi05172_g1215 [Venturia inaequalis]
MRFSAILAAAAAANSVAASSWFGKTDAVYNKWHETELERWLSDNNVPYPTPADRKDLETLIKSNWNDKVVSPYSSWDTKQLNSYLTSKGYEAKKGTEESKDSLLSAVKGYFTQTEDQIMQSYGNTKDWVLDSWTDSQLKAFLDKNGIPAPQPRNRDSLLKTARENYQTVATKLGETAAYPGDWLYASWSESDLKEWCDTRGIPVPQPSTRDKLIASVRRNSRVSSNYASAAYSSVSASAASASASLTNALYDSWSDTDLKAFLDKNGVKVPQGSKKNELIALARKYSASLTGDNVSASASSAYGAASSKAGNQYAQATEDAALKAEYAGNVAWSYLGWFKQQIGLGVSSVSSAAASATGVAAASLSSYSSSLSKAMSSASSSASKAALTSGPSAATSAGNAAMTSLSSASAKASSSALSSLSSASSSFSSYASSISSAASSASSSASKAAATQGPKEAQKAGDAAAESVSKAKHRVEEAYQQATDRAREEL